MPYFSLPDALNRTKERANIDPIDMSSDTFLTEMLTLSAAPDTTGTTHYRPFLVAALYYEQSPEYQLLDRTSAGEEFSKMVTAIASLRQLQSAYDLANQLSVPLGFAALKTRPPFGTTVVRRVPSF